MAEPTIWKYELDITDRQTLDLPVDAAVLHVGLDPAGTPSVWVIVDSDAATEDRRFAVVGTGNPCPFDEADHLGSFLQGPFVWHVFGEVG